MSKRTLFVTLGCLLCATSMTSAQEESVMTSTAIGEESAASESSEEVLNNDSESPAVEPSASEGSTEEVSGEEAKDSQEMGAESTAPTAASEESMSSEESTEEVPEAAEATTPVDNQPAAVEVSPEPAEKTEELVGIDTIDVDEPAGNWLYKRIYWERAEAKYQKIKELVMNIFDARTKFFEQRVTMDNDIFDPLYKTANFSRGELSSVLKELLEELEKSGGDEKGLEDDDARVLFAKVEANKDRLEEVKKELEFVGKIDTAVDEAINTLVGLLNQARNFDMQAWGDFKAISRELSDKKARDLFYRIDTYWRNVKDIEVYITTKLTEHMNYLASSAQQDADVVKGLLKDLQEKGFVLKDQVDALEKVKSFISDSTPAEEDELEPKAKEKTGGFFSGMGTVFSWIIKPFVAIAKGLWHTITIPFNYFLVQSKAVLALPEVVLEGESTQKQALS